MLGQAISMVLPKVIGYKLVGIANQLVTSTDIVLTVTKVFAFKNIDFKIVVFGRSWGDLFKGNYSIIDNKK
jgi:aconitate hydratase